MNSSKIKLSNQVEAIKYFIQKMDIEMIDAFLDKNKTYQDFEKSIFIDKLQVAFEEFKERGDTFLISIEGRCNGCDISKTGFSFVGNVVEVIWISYLIRPIIKLMICMNAQDLRIINH